MSKILTVSIAAYNVEKFLRKTLESLIKKDEMNDIEVLIINDGSKDNTLAVAQEYQMKYPGVFTVVDKENGGHGSTINKAISIAKGKYLTLLDGDDWVDTDEFYRFVAELKKIDVDLVVNNFNTVDSVTGNIITKRFENVKTNKVYTFETLPQTSIMGLSAITYRTEILKRENITIDENCFYVDMEFISFPIPYIETIIFLPFVVYQYRINQSTQSVSKESLLRHSKNHMVVSKNLLNFLNSFICSDKYSSHKENYIHQVIKNMILDEYVVLLLQSTSNENYRVLLDFDEYVKNSSYEIYNLLEDKFWIKLLRKKFYITYLVISFMMKKKLR